MATTPPIAFPPRDAAVDVVRESGLARALRADEQNRPFWSAFARFAATSPRQRERVMRAWTQTCAPAPHAAGPERAIAEAHASSERARDILSLRDEQPTLLWTRL